MTSLENVLDSLPENVIRAKGFALVDGEGWHILHRVYDSSTIMPLNGPAPNAGSILICIGQHLSADSISKVITSAG